MPSNNEQLAETRANDKKRAHATRNDKQRQRERAQDAEFNDLIGSLATNARDNPDAVVNALLQRPWLRDTMFAAIRQHHGSNAKPIIEQIEGQVAYAPSASWSERRAIHGLGDTASGTGGMMATARGHQGLIDVSDDRRTDMIFHALRAGKSLESFNQLAQWLMGKNTNLEQAYQARYRRGLVAHITEVFGDPKEHLKARYLIDCAEHGHPSFKSKLHLSLGTMTGSKAHDEEIVKIIEGMSPAEHDELSRDPVLMEAINNLEGRVSLHKQRHRAQAAIQAGVAQHAHDQATKGGANDKAHQTLGTGQARNEAAIRHLVSICKVHQGKVRKSLDLQPLFEELMEWATEHPPEVRAAAVQPSSEFMKFLDGLVEHREHLLNAFDRDYIVDLIRDHKPLPAELFLAAPKNDEDIERDGNDKKGRKSADKIHQVVAHGTRKAGKDYALKKQNYGHLRAEIAKLTPHEREGVLFLKLPVDVRERFESGDITPDERDHFRAEAIRLYAAELKEAGMDESERAKTLELFNSLHNADYGNKKSAYHALRDLAKSKTYVRDISFLKAVAQLKGSDFLHVRQDTKLLDALKERASDVWTRIEHMLGLTGVGGAAHEIEGAKVAERGSSRSAHDAANNAELRPQHWTEKLALALDQNSTVDVQLVVTQLYFAAKRCQEFKADPAAIGGAATIQPMAIGEFMGAARAGLPSDAKKRLADKKHGAAALALTRGTFVDPDLALEATEYHGRHTGKRVSGNDANADEVVEYMEAFSGSELLEQWSNIDAFRALPKPLATDPDEKRQRDARRRRDFILDLKPERHAWLQSHLSVKSLVPTLAKLRGKLQAAGEKDPEFQARLQGEQYEYDKLAQERTGMLSQLDTQAVKDTGAQYNKFASHSNERKEARNELIGEFRAAKADMDEADVRDGVGDKQRAKIVDEYAPKIEDKKEALERRTEAFDAMRKQAKDAIMLALTVVLAIITTAATMGMGSVGVAPILIKIILAVGAAAVKQGVLKALEGDEFNARAAFAQIGMAAAGAAVGSFGAWASGSAIEALGIGNPGNVLSPEGAGKVFTAQAIRSAINFGTRDALKLGYDLGTDEKPPSVGATVVTKGLSWLGSFAVTSFGTWANNALQQNQGTFTAVTNPGQRANPFVRGQANKVDMHGNTPTDQNKGVWHILGQQNETGNEGRGSKEAQLFAKGGLGKAFPKLAQKGINKGLGELEAEIDGEAPESQALEFSPENQTKADRNAEWVRVTSQRAQERLVEADAVVTKLIFMKEALEGGKAAVNRAKNPLPEGTRALTLELAGRSNRIAELAHKLLFYMPQLHSKPEAVGREVARTAEILGVEIDAARAMFTKYPNLVNAAAAREADALVAMTGKPPGDGAPGDDDDDTEQSSS